MDFPVFGQTSTDSACSWSQYGHFIGSSPPFNCKVAWIELQVEPANCIIIWLEPVDLAWHPNPVKITVYSDSLYDIYYIISLTCR